MSRRESKLDEETKVEVNKFPVDFVSRRRGVIESKDFSGTVTSLKEVGRVGIPSTAESWLEEQTYLFL